MDYKWLLFRFEGRIGRARYWLATLIILCSMILALLLLAAISSIFGIATGPFVIDIVGISASIQLGDDDPASKASLFPQLVTIPMTVVFAWSYAAASIKRLHDRDKSGWWMIPFVAATGLYGQFGDWLGNSWTAAFIGLAVFIAFSWAWSKCTASGSPLAHPVRSNALPSPRDPLARAVDTTSRWDQQSELEFVPHSAGPSPGPHVKRGA